MKAVADDKYGPFDVLDLRDIDKPAVKDGEVLVASAPPARKSRL
jgi:NADPH:quinone reductase-like Zn-dependent oxidoreductase